MMRRMEARTTTTMPPAAKRLILKLVSAKCGLRVPISDRWQRLPLWFPSSCP
jgi:hypothetical protein